MTPALLIARGLIIHWVTLWLAPVEYSFDMIESELVLAAETIRAKMAECLE